MKNLNPNLEKCIQRLEENTKKRIIDPDLEAYAINNLRDKYDILKFRKEYINSMKEIIEQNVKENKTQDHGVQLVNRGYSIQKVATFFVHDGLMYTLGHMFDQETLLAWYSVLPYMKRNFPKDMYQKK